MQEKDMIAIALDRNEHKVVVINSILFQGKKNLPWDEVEKYLRRYIGKIIAVAETGEEIHIGADFPSEFKGSEDTMKTKGGYRKAKANLIQGLEKMINIARKTKESDNLKQKNQDKAHYGWFRYLTRFALPVMDEKNVITHYNVFLATLVVRRDSRKKLFLYDVVNVKKENEAEFKL